MTQSNGTITRDDRILSILEKAVSSHQKGTSSTELDVLLAKVFSTTAWGFREILLVITVARILKPTYKASRAFYDCNPRALFEGPIRMVLKKYKIPHRKSGPLNIAKATVGINSQWAAQRRPLDVAKATVNLVKIIDKYSQNELENLVRILFSRFLNEATRVRDLIPSSDPKSDPILLFNLCHHLITDSPDAGNTPQRICGLLLEHQHSSDGIRVYGHEDRASVTSTTSKKPGDIIEEKQDGTISAVYEITVKLFNAARMSESWEAVKDFTTGSGKVIQEVVVICRREDILELIDEADIRSYIFGTTDYEDVRYIFVSIFDWIKAQIIKLEILQRLAFFSKLEAYILEPNTAEKVKNTWKDFFAIDVSKKSRD